MDSSLNRSVSDQQNSGREGGEQRFLAHSRGARFLFRAVAEAQDLRTKGGFEAITGSRVSSRRLRIRLIVSNCLGYLDRGEEK